MHFQWSKPQELKEKISPPPCAHQSLNYKWIFHSGRYRALRSGTVQVGIGLTVRPLTAWGGRISTLNLNYVAGYTGPLLFLFERTHNYPVHNQGLLPWRPRCLGESKVRSASLVRCEPESNQQVRDEQVLPLITEAVWHVTAGRRNQTDDLWIDSPLQ